MVSVIPLPDAFCFIQNVRIFKNLVYLTLNKSKIVDGGLFDSFPIGAITDNNLKKIGFQLISKKSKKISTLDYLVDIDTKFIKTLDFRITHNEIARLFDQGYFAAKRIIPIIEKHNKIM